MDCLFCKIAQGEIPAKMLYQDDDVVAFADIQPQAPHHILIIPRKHIATINDVEAADVPLIGKLVLTAKNLAKSMQIEETGYRLVFNVNSGGGQMVYHIHLHLLGGRQMIWPPG